MAVLLVYISLITIPAQADPINLGVITFDNLIPGAPGSPGVNDFNIDNLTGDPGTGGYALPPDFPVLTSVTFQSSAIMLASSQGTSTVDLGDLAPGSYNPASLEFPDTTTFSSAIFTAVISPTTLQLSDGTTVTISASELTAVLLPSAGNALTAGTDFVVLQVSNQVVSTPEPSYTWLILAAGLAIMPPWIRRARKAHQFGRDEL